MSESVTAATVEGVCHGGTPDTTILSPMCIREAFVPTLTVVRRTVCRDHETPQLAIRWPANAGVRKSS